jgi:hypothetical protein
VRRATVAIAGVMLLASASPSAHRLDEYLQATRVALSRTGVDVEMDLTPGASVAEAVIALIDGDGDEIISPVEAHMYGRAVIGDVGLEVEGTPLSLTLTRIEIPSVDEMRQGSGTIVLQARAVAPRAIGATPQLRFRNDHHPQSSVYLVNALMPSDAGITVVRQTRDTTQREATIDYDVRSQWRSQLYWPLVGLVVGGWWFARTRTSPLIPNP